MRIFSSRFSLPFGLHRDTFIQKYTHTNTNTNTENEVHKKNNHILSRTEQMTRYQFDGCHLFKPISVQFYTRNEKRMNKSGDKTMTAVHVHKFIVLVRKLATLTPKCIPMTFCEKKTASQVALGSLLARFRYAICMR